MEELHHHFAPPLTGVEGDAAAADFAWSSLWDQQEPIETTSSAVEEAELKRALSRATLELRSTRLAAQEELRRMESQAFHLVHLLEVAKRERDEARHALLLLLNHSADDRRHRSPNAPYTGSRVAFTLDDLNDVADPAPAAVDQEEEEETSNRMSSPAPPLAVLAEVEAAAVRKGLPEKGRLVETVMEAGPLLQTLLLAGPLPQWRHPPPALRSLDIPPVAVSWSFNGASGGRNAATTATPTELGVQKRGSPSSSSSSPESEHSNSGFKY